MKINVMDEVAMQFDLYRGIMWKVGPEGKNVFRFTYEGIEGWSGKSWSLQDNSFLLNVVFGNVDVVACDEKDIFNKEEYNFLLNILEEAKFYKAAVTFDIDNNCATLNDNRGTIYDVHLPKGLFGKFIGENTDTVGLERVGKTIRLSEI